MSAELLRIHPDNPEMRKIHTVVDCLRQGGVVIYPTDTIYGLGCDITNLRAIERVAQIKGVNAQKTSFAFICHDLSHISDYAKIDTNVFKVMKKALPGAFTFIVPATTNVPKMLKARTKTTVGIRIPDNNIPRTIVQELGNPIITTSIKGDDDTYPTNAELIWEKYKHQVDYVIDGGIGSNQHSTIVNCLNDEFEIIREGAGKLDAYL